MHPKKKIIIASIISIGLFLGIVAFVVYPIWGGILADHEQLLLQERELNRIRVDVGNVEKFERLKIEQQAEFQKFDNLFINPDPPVEFIEFLEEKAQDSRFVLTITPGNPQKVKDDLWPSMNFSISARGTYQNFLRFLKQIENSPFLVEVQSITMDGLGEQRRIGNQTRKLPSEEISFILPLKVYTR